MWLQSLTVVRFRGYRVQCPDCGVRTEALDFVNVRGPHVTKSLGHLFYELCKVMTRKAGGTLLGLHRGTVREIDKAMMEKIQSERSLDGITILEFDEIGVGKGQTYGTLVSALGCLRGPELLNTVEGHKEKTLKPFWAWFGKDRSHQITHRVIDTWKPYLTSLLAHCPKVCVVYDKFHVIRHLLDAVNKVRNHEFRRLAEPMRGILASKKFVLLSRRSNLTWQARKALEELLLESPRLL